MHLKRIIFALGLAPWLTSSPAAEPDWSPTPWIEDLQVIKTALETRYANREWMLTVRGIDVDAMLERTTLQVEAAGSDMAARAVIDRMLLRFHDGHVQIDWPSVEKTPSATKGASVCGSLGFAEGGASYGIGPSLPGYVALEDDGVFAAGTILLGRDKIGVIRISEFQPQPSPGLCRAAERSLNIVDDEACDDKCRDRLMESVYADYTQHFARRLTDLHRAGASLLIVDLTKNGGGSEWAEAAARMLVAKPLTSEALGFVRGDHWARHWHEIATDLDAYAVRADVADKAQLNDWIAQARAAEQQARTRCTLGTGCAWLGRAGYATGLVGRAPAEEFRGKPWAPTVFSPAQYAYQDGLWSGPLIVLVNDGTGSAAEEFAAILQDNDAAVIVGARTVGAGCGHTDGGTPTTLPNSGGVLEVPDCARLRRDGSNEVDGVIPDVLVPWRYYDSAARAAALLLPALPDAIARARRDCSRPSAANPSLRSGPSPLCSDVLQRASRASSNSRPPGS